jgi:hypothetical protein
MNTKILLSDYLIIIAKNLIQSQSPKQQDLPNQLYSMLSYELSSENVSINDEGEAPYPLTSIPINLSSEILVTMPHLTPNYFVKCT